ncbi:MAG: hypothetical protein OXH72_01220 [Caldilineaceae bacterium]|nr:hypothetical protein [Caldilineaceae bacterium]
MGLWSHWAGIHHVWPVSHRTRVLVMVVGEPESKLASLREENAEWQANSTSTTACTPRHRVAAPTP